MTPVPVLGNPQGARWLTTGGWPVCTQHRHTHIYTKTPNFDVDHRSTETYYIHVKVKYHVDPKEDVDVAEAASQLGSEY